jgi:predicted sulfurtransferase
MFEVLKIATFYRFSPIEETLVAGFKAELESMAKTLAVQGLVILGVEGVNATISGKESGCRTLIEYIESSLTKFKNPGETKHSALLAEAAPAISKTTLTGAAPPNPASTEPAIANSPDELNQPEPILVKWSEAAKHPFLKFKVRVRREIVSLHKPDILPEGESDSYLEPEAWNEMLKRDDVVCIDTRNTYETRIGKFKTAIDPKISEFNTFPEFVNAQGYKKDQKILVYCTGGIRCEKAAVDLKAQGFNEVYQLEGGILNYLEAKKAATDSEWQGECFVFDYRVAVDAELRPSQTYRLCPHCGQPADIKVACLRCDTEFLICPDCHAKCSDKLSLSETVSREVDSVSLQNLDLQDDHKKNHPESALKANLQKIENVRALTCSRNCENHWQKNPGQKGRPQKEVLKARGII